MNRRKITVFGLIFALSFMMVSPMFAQAQTTVPGFLKSGPYIDTLVFNVITQDDQQVLALQVPVCHKPVQDEDHREENGEIYGIE